MTIEQIIQQVAERRKISRKQVYRCLKVCRIKPAGLRTRPQHYPEDAAKKILTSLGLQIVSMDELRLERRRATRRRAR